MSTLLEIKAALPNLTAAERAELERCLRQDAIAAEKPIELLDYAARRRAIYGDRVMAVNAVLEARESQAS